MRNPRHVTVRVDGKRWRRVLSFSDSGSADHHFLLETKPNGSTTVRFGDGVHGASPRKALKGTPFWDRRWCCPNRPASLYNEGP
jgi:hypothetical protein